MSDSEGEAAESQVWLDFAQNCGYIDTDTREELDQEYERIMAQLVKMIDNAEKWVIKEHTDTPTLRYTDTLQ